MKKTLFVILIVVFTLVSLLFGCSDDKLTEEGVLSISINGMGYRGIEPVSMETVRYDITVKNSSDAIVYSGWANLDTDLNLSTPPGLYKVSVNSKNADGFVIGSGYAEGEVVAGSTTELVVVVSELKGNGTLSISVGAEKDRSILYSVLTSVGTSVVSGSLVYDDGAYQAEVELPNGFYILQIRNAETGKNLKTESFRIVKDQITEFSFAVSISASLEIYKVGDIGPAGGYIFYDCDADNDTGNSDGLISTEVGWRYLEAAPADLRMVNGVPTVDSSLSEYSSGRTVFGFGYYRTSDGGINKYVNGTVIHNLSDCTGTAIGTGKSNTQLLVSAMGMDAYSEQSEPEKTGTYAARLCEILSYTVNGVTYDDWFLPSKDELDLMYTNLKCNGLGGFVGNVYWSSSEYVNKNFINSAWKQGFDDGIQSSYGRSRGFMMRPVRAFLTDEICEHVWDEGVVSSEEACERNGVKTYTCTGCNMTKVEIIPMTGHQVIENHICMACGQIIPFIGPTGGYVFYDCDADNNFGNADGLISTEVGWRYLEAAPADLHIVNGVPTVDSTFSGYSSGTESICFGLYKETADGSSVYVNGTTTYSESNCTGTAIGTGQKNTQMLIGVMGNTNAYGNQYVDEDYVYGQTNEYAARLCDILTYTVNGVTYDDWFLPSKDELNIMHVNLNKVDLLGGFDEQFYYWSSSESSYRAGDAWQEPFFNAIGNNSYCYFVNRVRAVRAFMTDEVCKHVWDEGVVTCVPCETNGVKTYTCTECNMTKVEIIPKTGHCFGEWIIRTEATMTTEGEKYRSCSVCGYEETAVIPVGKYAVGDIGPAGGYIFYDCDADNDYGNRDGLISTEVGWKYLEAAPADLRVVEGVPTVDSSASGYSNAKVEYIFGFYRYKKTHLGTNLFVNGTNEYDSSFCTGFAVGSGMNNTQLLASVMGTETYSDHSGSATTGEYAARLCDILEYTVNGVTYDDWFLPSEKELEQMVKNLNDNNSCGFAAKSYWTSSETTKPDSAWVRSFSIGGGSGTTDRKNAFRVRPVRAFLTDEVCDHVWDEGVVTAEFTCERNGTRTYTCTKCNMTKVELIEQCHVADDEHICKFCNQLVPFMGPSGGWVFYNCDADNDSGNADGLISSEVGWKYLEAAPSDLCIVDGVPTVDSSLEGYASGIAKICFGEYHKAEYGSSDLYVNGTTTFNYSYSTSSMKGTGQRNTQMLVDAMGNKNAYGYYFVDGSRVSGQTDEYAARMCDMLTYTFNRVTYDDWFLPSQKELDLMCESLHRKDLGDFANDGYWSSSESQGAPGEAWIISFSNSNPYSYRRNNTYRVRPIRAFMTEEVFEHVWDKGVVISEATCERNGLKTYTCTECNLAEDEIIPMLDHSYGEWVVRTETTMTTVGEKYRICSVCGHEDTSIIPVASYAVGDIGPAGGYIFYDCDADNDSGNEDGLISSEVGWRYLEAAPADLRIVNEALTVDSTLLTYSSGTKSFIFGYYRETADGSNLHVNGKTTYDSSNCTRTTIGAGNRNTQLLVSAMGAEAYRWGSGSEKTGDYAARLCDILTYTVNGVTYDDWFLPSEDELNQMFMILNENDTVSYSANSYWSSSEGAYGGDARLGSKPNGSRSSYARSNTTLVRPARAFLTDEVYDHSWDDGVVTTEATCERNGVKTYTCTECNRTKVEIIPIVDHSYGEWIVRTPATTTAKGEKYMECSVCGRGWRREIPMLTYAIGDMGPAGGYIFYDCDADNNSGNSDGLVSKEVGWRYLEAAPADLRVVDGIPTVDSSLIGYSSATAGYVFGYYRITGTVNNLFVNGKTKFNSEDCTSSRKGSGKTNTQLLVAAMGTETYSSESGSRKTGNYAARLCDILTYTVDEVTYDDWFLPSDDELTLMWINLKQKSLGNFDNSYYWSSSEYGSGINSAWYRNFSSGNRNCYSRSSTSCHVRPVRAF